MRTIVSSRVMDFVVVPFFILLAAVGIAESGIASLPLCLAGAVVAIFGTLGAYSEYREWKRSDLSGIVDLDAAPMDLERHGYAVVEHKKLGMFKFDPAKIALHASPRGLPGDESSGHALRAELESETVFNASLLDWLLKHRRYIPEGWKKTLVFFWGTIYRRKDGKLYVRGLSWRDGEWREDLIVWIDIDWSSGPDTAAAVAKDGAFSSK